MPVFLVPSFVRSALQTLTTDVAAN